MRRCFFIVILLFAFFQGYSQELGYSLRLKLNPPTDRSYLATEDAGIKALASRHGLALKQTYPGFENESLLFYDLTGKTRMSRENRDAIVKDFFATGKFEEEYVYNYGVISRDSFTNPVHVNNLENSETVYRSSSSCQNAVSVDDPDFISSHGWALRMIDAPCAWSITTGNPNILIGIADTEFLQTHEDLQGKFESVVGQGPFMPFFHGTSVSSVAAANTNNGLGMAGVGYNSRIAASRVEFTGYQSIYEYDEAAVKRLAVEESL